MGGRMLGGSPTQNKKSETSRPFRSQSAKTLYRGTPTSPPTPFRAAAPQELQRMLSGPTGSLRVPSGQHQHSGSLLVCPGGELVSSLSHQLKNPVASPFSTIVGQPLSQAL